MEEIASSFNFWEVKNCKYKNVPKLLALASINPKAIEIY